MNSRRAKRPWLRSSSRFHNTAGKGFPQRELGRWRGVRVGVVSTGLGGNCNIANWERVGVGRVPKGRIKQGEKTP